ncbi:hypothetical protein HELRODRAFT_165533 [Helobdella robusta]|uniref:Uncharacterized protein n=1 Tax=Helobdella robusta TaxID=6412 RepID=T1EWZ2_HELRO|nr:hypothetical protein HELRODRAFT_165533 [Helobdella robusta]ESN91491.1 hypothetical protein HELRODRAFT_165533 [Helobdella robusta]
MPLKHTAATTIALIIIIIISITISPSSSSPDYYEDLPTPQDNLPSTKHDRAQSTASPHHDQQHLTIQHDDDHENTSHDDYHGNGSHHNHDQHHGDHQHHGIHVASIKFDYVKQPLILSIFMIVVIVQISYSCAHTSVTDVRLFMNMHDNTSVRVCLELSFYISNVQLAFMRSCLSVCTSSCFHHANFLSSWMPESWFVD